MKRDFDVAAKTWDLNDARTRVSLAIADAMIDELELNGTEVLLDYGSGTGTVALRMQPLVKEVIAADSSRGMLEVLENKVKELGVPNVRTVLMDLERQPAPPREVHPNVIVSVMALHHIEGTRDFCASLFQMLSDGGRVAIADLDQEDGDFHPDNTGVYHFGFDRRSLARTDLRRRRVPRGANSDCPQRRSLDARG